MADRDSLPEWNELSMPVAQEIADGMLQWEPGSLSSHTMNRVLQDVLADIWRDEWRRGGDFQAQLTRYNQRVNRLHDAVTEGRWHGQSV